MINNVTLEGTIIRLESMKLCGSHYRIEFDLSVENKNEVFEIKCKAFDSYAMTVHHEASKGDTVVLTGFLEPVLYKGKQTNIVVTAVCLRVIQEENKRGILDHVKASNKVHKLEGGS